MKSPPVMDPEAPPPPSTPPYDDEVWWADGRSCLVFQRPNLVRRLLFSPSPWFLNLGMPMSVGFLAILEGPGPEMC
jgi:hypothetical protein